MTRMGYYDPAVQPPPPIDQLSQGPYAPWGQYDPAFPPATRGIAGAPGYYAPKGAKIPADGNALVVGGVAATPTTAWAPGQYVPTADGRRARWTGASWAPATMAEADEADEADEVPPDEADEADEVPPIPAPR